VRQDYTKRGKMIKVIEGYELKKDGDIQPVFLKLRSCALTFPGYISAENIRSADNTRNVQDTSIVALLYNWDRLGDWEAWKGSKLRQRILKEIEPLLASEPRITIYEVVPTSAGTYTKY
jgi:heme-degrading monooxygenase HmoA